LSLIGLAKSAPTCNSFPNIFGSYNGVSWLFQIDVYNNYLAIAGTTYDNLVTGKTGYG
jgi:hypothetical protein